MKKTTVRSLWCVCFSLGMMVTVCRGGDSSLSLDFSQEEIKRRVEHMLESERDKSSVSQCPFYRFLKEDSKQRLRIVEMAITSSDESFKKLLQAAVELVARDIDDEVKDSLVYLDYFGRTGRPPFLSSHARSEDNRAYINALFEAACWAHSHYAQERVAELLRKGNPLAWIDFTRSYGERCVELASSNEPSITAEWARATLSLSEEAKYSIPLELTCPHSSVSITPSPLRWSKYVPSPPNYAGALACPAVEPVSMHQYIDDLKTSRSDDITEELVVTGEGALLGLCSEDIEKLWEEADLILGCALRAEGQKTPLGRRHEITLWRLVDQLVVGGHPHVCKWFLDGGMPRSGAHISLRMKVLNSFYELCKFQVGTEVVIAGWYCRSGVSFFLDDCNRASSGQRAAIEGVRKALERLCEAVIKLDDYIMLSDFDYRYVMDGLKIARIFLWVDDAGRGSETPAGLVLKEFKFGSAFYDEGIAALGIDAQIDTIREAFRCPKMLSGK